MYTHPPTPSKLQEIVSAPYLHQSLSILNEFNQRILKKDEHFMLVYRRSSINPGYVAQMPNRDNWVLSLVLVAEEYLVQRQHTAICEWNAHNDVVLIPAI